MAKGKAKIEAVSPVNPLAGYEVVCQHCKQDFEVSLYPTYCVACGGELEPRPLTKREQKGGE